MITVRCSCGEVKRFADTKTAREAGWWVNPDPGEEPGDFCPTHNTSEFVTEEGHGCCGHGPYKD